MGDVRTNSPRYHIQSVQGVPVQRSRMGVREWELGCTLAQPRAQVAAQCNESP